MSDTSNTPDTPDAEQAPDVEAPETDYKAEAERLKAESRKWEQRAKENAKAAQRLAEFEESQKTDLEKAVGRAEAAEKELAGLRQQAQVTAWKSEIAAASGVPADALRGSTREELETHAEALKPLLTSAQRGPYVPSPAGIPDVPVSDDAAFVRGLFNRN